MKGETMKRATISVACGLAVIGILMWIVDWWESMVDIIPLGVQG